MVTESTEDRFAAMWRLQAELTTFIQEHHPEQIEANWEMRALKLFVAIVAEGVEYLNELNWKDWKTPFDAKSRRQARLIELVDVLHFVIQLAQNDGYTLTEVYEAYVSKNHLNRQRQVDHPAYGGSGASDGKPSSTQKG